MKSYFVYNMNSATGTLYVGVTNDLQRRVQQHKLGNAPGFTSRYKVDRLAYFEAYIDVRLAIEREKEIKGWLRMKKIELIKSVNPTWRDLAQDLDIEPNLVKGRIDS